MSAKINPAYLRTNELSYEISLRGVEPPSNADDKRKVLRGLLSQESADRSFSFSSESEAFKDMTSAVKESLGDITDLVKKFSGSVSDTDYKRLITRLTHATGRVRRATPANNTEKSDQQKLLTEIMILESDLADKVNLPSQEFHQSSPIAPQQFTYVKKVPIYKWGIRKFSGKGSLMSFLELVDALKVSRGCSDLDLFESAGDLFESEAWMWWHTNHSQGRFSSWSDLVGNLKKTFLHSNYDQVLLDEIKARKQRQSEPVNIFISTLESMFYRLTRTPSEDEIVNIIRGNLLPSYVNALVLQDIDTISDLVRLCKRIEDTLSLKVSSSRHVEKVCTVSDSFASCAVSVTCWNCGQSGHRYNTCHKDKTLFCFGCGLKDTVKSKCPKCSKNFLAGRNLADIAGPSRNVKSSAQKSKPKK